LLKTLTNHLQLLLVELTQPIEHPDKQIYSNTSINIQLDQPYKPIMIIQLDGILNPFP